MTGVIGLGIIDKDYLSTLNGQFFPERVHEKTYLFFSNQKKLRSGSAPESHDLKLNEKDEIFI